MTKTRESADATDGAAAAADDRLLTRSEAAAFLRSHGYRISYSTLTKICSPAINTGPPSVGKFGRDNLYQPSVLLAWARTRMSPGGDT